MKKILTFIGLLIALSASAQYSDTIVTEGQSFPNFKSAINNEFDSTLQWSPTEMTGTQYIPFTDGDKVDTTVQFSYSETQNTITLNQGYDWPGIALSNNGSDYSGMYSSSGSLILYGGNISFSPDGSGGRIYIGSSASGNTFWGVMESTPERLYTFSIFRRGLTSDAAASFRVDSAGSVFMPLLTGTGTGTSILHFNRSTGELTYADDAGTGSSDSSFVQIQTDSIYELTADNGVDIENVHFEDGVVTAATGTSTEWNTAYGWGNHASEGYLTAGGSLTNNAILYYNDPGSTWTAVAMSGDVSINAGVTTIADDAVQIDDLDATGTADATTYLRGDGAWSTPAGSGDVSKVGTPVNNQVGVWTGDGTLEGDVDLTFDGDNLTVDGTVTGTGFIIGSANINETELEIIDGATLTTTELNYVDGVTSAIQTQLDAKLDASDTVEVTYGYGLDTSWTASNAMTLTVDTTTLETKFWAIKDTVVLASFNASDSLNTSFFYGSFYNGGSDTLVVTEMIAVLQGSSPSVAVDIEWHATFDDGSATHLNTTPPTITSTTTGDSDTTFDNDEIPPGVWVWCKTPTVTTEPTYMSVTLLGYRKNRSY